MTRSISADLEAHFGSETTTIAMLWKVTRTDGTVLGFTNHDENITYNSVVYLAASGFIPSDVALKSDFSVSNHEIQGILDSNYIDEDDLLAGRYDYAEIEMMLINYTDVTDGVVMLPRGWLGQVQLKDGQFIAEVRGLSEKINKNIGQIYSPTCRAILGDSRCKVNLAPYTATVSVTSVTDKQNFKSSALTQANGYFTGGEVEFTSGNNNGLKMEVKAFQSTQITLALPMPYTVQSGDTFRVIAGCDKAFETCKTKFNNVINFRGEPHVPGQDAILETAGTFGS